jgi:hypothetical protein
LFDVGVHSGPVVVETNTMKCTVGIEMSTYGIRMKCNKDDVAKFYRNELEAGVGRSPSNWFVENQHIIFNPNLRLAECGPIVVIHHT